MKKRLTEHELFSLVKRIMEEDIYTDIEDKDWKEENIDDLENMNKDSSEFDDSEFIDNNYSEFDDLEDNEYITTPFDDIDKEVRLKNFMKHNKPSSSTIGSGRWDASSNKPYNPIKPTDLPLEKFLSSKFNKRK